MTSPFKSIFLAVVLTVAAGTLFGQGDPRLGVQLSLGEGKTMYRAGESITLVLTFKAYVDGYSVRVGHEIIDTVLDDVRVSPDKGVFEWKKQYMRGGKYTTDAIHLHPLSEGPVKVEIPLNHFVRFDAPGRYSVKVTTKRIWLGQSDVGLELTPNDVSFEVRMMTEVEESAEAARLAVALDKATGWEQARIMTQLSYLTGNSAIPEKVKRFLAQDASGNYHPAALYGLYMSKDRRLVIKMLEDVFRDVDRPVNFELLGVLSSLKLLEEVPVPVKPMTRTPFHFEEEPDERRIRDRYLKEIVDSLPNRKGKNLREAAFVILQNLQRKDPPADVLAKVRPILITHFDDLTMIGHEMLLLGYWDLIRDPSLIPSLEKILKNQMYPDNLRHSMKSHALKRLTELDPIRARPFLIAEIRNPDSMLDGETLDLLEDRRIPDVDDVLVQQIRRFGVTEYETTRLRSKCMLAAKFATKAVFDQLLDFYNANSTKWGSDSRAFLISYFSRHDPQKALEMLDAEMTRLNEDAAPHFLHDMTSFYYAPELTPFLERRLASDNARLAISGAYILSKHGPKSSRPKIEARLKRWVDRWRDREFELEGIQMKPENKYEPMLQVELIHALRDGKNWKLDNSELEKMIADCRTIRCDQNFRPQKFSRSMQ